MRYKLTKSVMDVVGAVALLVLLSPLLLLLTVLLAVANQGDPFFLQPRPGRNGQIFRIVKFRTMNDRRDAAGDLLPDEKRLTRLGRFVRRTSLDELPQLLNVLAGDMSLVGPRPLLPEYLSLYTPEQARRHEVKPGITGWAQVNGRNAISWEEKFRYDVWYVDKRSLMLDLRILLCTLIKVFKKEGINTAGVATTIKYKGNDGEAKCP